MSRGDRERDLSSGEFKARFEGHCQACDHRILEGQWVKYDRDGNLVHVDCDD